MNQQAMLKGVMAAAAAAAVLAFFSGGCGGGRPLPPETLVVTVAGSVPRTPLLATTNLARGTEDYGDLFYPPNSKLALLLPQQPHPPVEPRMVSGLPWSGQADRSTNQVAPKDLRELSRALFRAGGPVVTPDGRRVFFSGKATPQSAWQIYEVELPDGRPRPITALPGGAMSPACLPDGALVFSSPVPKAGEVWTTSQPAALYVMKPGQAPRRITFGPHSALDPTVLGDGRILFVSALTRENPATPFSLGLFTVNSDGTEVTRFALDGDGPPLVARPRELPGKRVAFLTQGDGRLVLQYVSTARPFLSRTNYTLPGYLQHENHSAVEAWGAKGDLLCVTPRLRPKIAPITWLQMGILTYPAASGTEVQFLAPLWCEYSREYPLSPRIPEQAKASVEKMPYLWPVYLEAAPVSPRPAPMGHMSSMSPAKKTGIILCMDANYHRQGRTRATVVRVTARIEGKEKVLGELPLQPDGSFIAEVPADTLLGFETLENGRVAHRQPPSLWVRAGENRSCIGCHEPYNRSPRNLRPQAANLVPPVLSCVKD